MKISKIGWIVITFLIIVVIDSSFDFGKWAIGRYTEISVVISVILLISFSALLAFIVEMIHHFRRIQERRYEQYYHHKIRVWVRNGQKGKHHESSLCPECELFKPDTADNCHIESTIHTLARLNHQAIVIWECPQFIKGQGGK